MLSKSTLVTSYSRKKRGRRFTQMGILPQVTLSEVRCQESFIRKYTYKEFMELSLDIIIQHSLVYQHKHNKQCHGEHLGVTMAPEKPGRHQPYFESRAHTDFIHEQPTLEVPQRPVAAEEAPDPGNPQQSPSNVLLSIISIYFIIRR